MWIELIINDLQYQSANHDERPKKYKSINQITSRLNTICPVDKVELHMKTIF